MATYMEIVKYVKEKYGFMPSTSWIAEVKEMCGLPVNPSHNRRHFDKRKIKCPPDKAKLIKEALRHFGMLQ